MPDRDASKGKTAMPRMLLSDDWAHYQSGVYNIVNNVWGKHTLVNGVDFTQTIQFDTSAPTSNIQFNWNWPTNSPFGVLAYPEITAGYKPWDEAGGTALESRVDELKDFDVSFDLDISGQTDQYNVAMEFWMTSKAQGGAPDITTEVMVWLHNGNFNPAGQVTGTYADGGYASEIYVENSMDVGTGQSWRYIAMRPDTEFLNGTIDLHDVLVALERAGLVKPSDYITGFELGAEVIGGTGGMTINSVSYEFARQTITEGDDTITGTEKRDNLIGRGGNDAMSGGGGDDRLDGGSGRDTMSGGLGNDLYTIDNVLDTIVEASGTGTGTDFIYSSVSFTLAANTERLYLTGTGSTNGTGRNGLFDVLTGNIGNNILNGLTGNDVMRGGLGHDIYIVDATSDIVEEAANAGTDAIKSTATFTMTANTERLYLIGTAAIDGTGLHAKNDLIVGNSATNKINGLTGNDTLIGGLGLDTFIFNTALNAATNHDTITDFNAADDTINLENAIFTLLAATGALAANLFENTSIAGQSGSEVIIYDRANGDLYYDTNGAATVGGLVLFADIANNTALTAADFVVV